MSTACHDDLWRLSRKHLAPEDLFRFVVGSTSQQEDLVIVRHLLTRCPACTAVFQTLVRHRSVRASPLDSSASWDPWG
jgi:hypothetical protein